MVMNGRISNSVMFSPSMRRFACMCSVVAAAVMANGSASANDNTSFAGVSEQAVGGLASYSVADVGSFPERPDVIEAPIIDNDDLIDHPKFRHKKWWKYGWRDKKDVRYYKLAPSDKPQKPKPKIIVVPSADRVLLSTLDKASVHYVFFLTTPFLRGEEIEELQNALVKMGIFVTVDGVFGHQTEWAIKTFQKQEGLRVTGVADSDTLEALGLI